MLEDILRHYFNPKQNNWDELLSATEFAVNNAYQKASVQGTPCYLNCGRHPRLPSDLALKARFPEEACSTGDASVPAKRTGKRRKTVGGLKAGQRP